MSLCQLLTDCFVIVCFVIVCSSQSNDVPTSTETGLNVLHREHGVHCFLESALA